MKPSHSWASRKLWLLFLSCVTSHFPGVTAVVCTFASLIFCMFIPHRKLKLIISVLNLYSRCSDEWGVLSVSVSCPKASWLPRYRLAALPAASPELPSALFPRNSHCWWWTLCSYSFRFLPLLLHFTSIEPILEQLPEGKIHEMHFLRFYITEKVLFLS